MLWNLLYSVRHLNPRCPLEQLVYHLAYGVLMAGVWHLLAQPRYKWLAGNTGEFWLGLFLITGLMLVRSTVWGCLVHLAGTPGGVWVAYRGYLLEAGPALWVLGATLKHPLVIDIFTHHGSTGLTLTLAAGAAIALLTTPLSGILLGRALSRYQHSLKWALLFPVLGIAAWLAALLFVWIFGVGLYSRTTTLVFPFLPLCLALLGSLACAMVAQGGWIPLGTQPSLPSVALLSLFSFVLFVTVTGESIAGMVFSLTLILGQMIGLWLEGVLFADRPFPLWALLSLLVTAIGVSYLDRFAWELTLLVAVFVASGAALQLALNRTLIVVGLAFSSRGPARPV